MRTHCLLCVIRYAMQLTDGDELDLNAADMNNNGRAENDYKVNLKTEIMIEDLYDKVNAIFALQKELLKELRLQNEGVNPAARQTQNTMTPHTQSIDPESTTAIEAVVQTATDNS